VSLEEAGISLNNVFFKRLLMYQEILIDASGEAGAPLSFYLW
jgi:hypothetical protein